MAYNILVLDIDGTLTNNKKEITERNRKAVVELQSRGVKVVLASGRPVYGIVPIANQIELHRYGGYILAYNGGQIIDCKDNSLVYSNVLPNDVVPILYDCAVRNDMAILSYKGEKILTERPSDEYVMKEAFLNKMEIEGCDDFMQTIELPVPKCLIVGEPNKLIGVETEVKGLVQGKINVFRSEPYFLELVPQGIDKAMSLATLLSKLGIAKEEMVAIGDGFNDLSMIEYAGLGIAMDNAQEAVKRAANHVTASNEEDGVAQAIEKFF